MSDQSDMTEEQRAEDNRRPLLVLRVVFFLCILNFGAFIGISRLLGGDANNGKVEPGHYYVGDHGHYTEVGGAVYQYSRWHARSIWITHSLAFLSVFGMMALGPRKQKKF